MTQLNLLPWREELRLMQKTQFLTSLLAGCIFSFLVFLMFDLHYRSAAKEQNTLNSMLSMAINE